MGGCAHGHDDLAAAGDYETERGGQYGIIRRDRRKPLIAAVEGPALGGGMEIVLACDLVVASTSSRFGLPEVRRGVVPTCAALFRGPQTLPLNIAREMILTGESITANRAYAVGLVNLVTELGFALTGAIELAQRIAANAPLSVQACLFALNEFAGHSDEQGWESTSRAVAAIEGTDDVQEGCPPSSRSGIPDGLGTDEPYVGAPGELVRSRCMSQSSWR
jgi:enoyl-CoA hydratase